MSAARWRVGRHVKRTVYMMVGPEPSADDICVGLMDSAALAEQVVNAVNTVIDAAEEVALLERRKGLIQP